MSSAAAVMAVCAFDASIMMSCDLSSRWHPVSLQRNEDSVQQPSKFGPAQTQHSSFQSTLNSRMSYGRLRTRNGLNVTSSQQHIS